MKKNSSFIKFGLGVFFLLLGSVCLYNTDLYTSIDSMVGIILVTIYVLGIILLSSGFIEFKLLSQKQFPKRERITNQESYMHLKSIGILFLAVLIVLLAYLKMNSPILLLLFLIMIFLFVFTKIYSEQDQERRELEIFIDSKSTFLGLVTFLLIIFFSSLAYFFYNLWIKQDEYSGNILILILLLTLLLLLIEFIKIILAKKYQ
jgi:hypothetical protein